jgi:hypothetical protein
MREHMGGRTPVLPAEVRAMRSRGTAVFFMAVCVLLATAVLAAAELPYWFGPPPGDWENVVQAMRVTRLSAPGACLTYLLGGSWVCPKWRSDGV